MKTSSTVVLSIVIVVTIAVLTFNGCDNSNMVDFHKVVIPEYSNVDYIALLDNKNPDVVYNSVCNLLDEASDFGKTLANDTLKDSVKIKTAELAYSKIAPLVASKNEWVACSAIRFLANFGGEYNNKDELVKVLLKVKLKTKSVHLETINAFNSIGCQNTKLYRDHVKSYFSNSSWLINRYSYNLAGMIKDAELNKLLIAQYNAQEDEFEKLLVLQALSNEYEDTVFVFIANEIKKSTTKKTHLFLIKNLQNAADKAKVCAWIAANPKVLSINSSEIADHYISVMESQIGCQVVLTLLSNGFSPDSLLENTIPKLYKQLLEKITNLKNKPDTSQQDQKSLEYLLSIEKAIEVTPLLAAQWNRYKTESVAPTINKEFKAKHAKMTDDFALRTSQLFDKYKIDKVRKDEYLKKLRDLDNEYFNSK